MKTCSLLAVILVSGCATATNSPQEIDYAAKMSYLSQACSGLNLMDQETAAKGLALANSMVYRAETPKYKARLQELSGDPSQQNCTDLRLKILAAVASRGMHTSQSAPAPDVPRYTNCNTYFGQTYCTTY